MRKFIPLLIIAVAFCAYEVVNSRWNPTEGGEGASKTIAVESASMLSVPVVDPAEPTATGEIRRGTPFFVAMKRAGITPVEIQSIVTASKELFNFRRVRPGQEYSVYDAGADGIDSLHFVIDRARTLKVTRGETGFETRIDTIPYTIEHRATTGAITSSIYETLKGSGADSELASHLAVIFQWDIDFFKDIRKGDSFTILWESKAYPDGREEIRRVKAARVLTRGQDHYAVAFRTSKGSVAYYDEKGKSLQKSLLRAPLRYSRVSSGFTHRRLHPVHGVYKPHLGVDYAAPSGTPVRSTGDGTVSFAGYRGGNGKYVKIRHNSRYTTYYLHLSRFAKGVRNGARVRQGQVIGYVGSTGTATSPHLDYRIKVGDKFVNPRTIRLPSKEPVPGDDTARFEIARDTCIATLLESTLTGGTTTVNLPAHPGQYRMCAVIQ